MVFIENIYIVLSVAILFTYIIPLIYTWLNMDFFTYVNAWDEETYLTYQGAIGSLKSPGYTLGAALTLLFQYLGLSGSVQNLLFDLILIPLMVFFLYKIFIYGKVPKGYAFVLAVVTLFASVLFNYANPLLSTAYPIRDVHFLMFGHENYASVLRTPNPELSYVIVLAALHFFLKTSKMIFLFLPLLFLYFYVAVPYEYFLSIYLVLRYIYKEYTWKNIIYASVIAFIILGLGMLMMDYLFIKGSHIEQLNDYYVRTRSFFMPLDALFSFLFIIGQYMVYRKEHTLLQKRLLQIQVLLFLSFVFIGNTQLISGYILSYKNYYDYSFSLLIGFALSIFIYSLLQSKIKGFVLHVVITSIVLTILLLNLASHRFHFSKMQYQIYMGGSVDNTTLAHILRDPQHALVDYLDYRAKIAYGKALTIAPPFSYHYIFSFIDKQCVFNPVLHNNAIYYLSKTSPNRYRDFRSMYETYMKSLRQSSMLPYGVMDYCKKSIYTNTNFFSVDVNRSMVWSYFPDYDKKK